MPADKLYIVTRANLPPGAQVAQACHAALAFSAEHGEHSRWASATLAVLAADSETTLEGLCENASRRGLRLSTFREPDMADALTAIAIEPSALTRRLCSRFPLALA